LLSPLLSAKAQNSHNNDVDAEESSAIWRCLRKEDCQGKEKSALDASRALTSGKLWASGRCVLDEEVCEQVIGFHALKSNKQREAVQKRADKEQKVVSEAKAILAQGKHDDNLTGDDLKKLLRYVSRPGDGPFSKLKLDTKTDENGRKLYALVGGVRRREGNNEPIHHPPRK
jgi:hypothetical protein